MTPEQLVEQLEASGLAAELVVTTTFAMRQVNRVRRAASGTMEAVLVRNGRNLASVAIRGGQIVDVLPNKDAPYEVVRPILEVMGATALPRGD